MRTITLATSVIALFFVTACTTNPPVTNPTSSSSSASSVTSSGSSAHTSSYAGWQSYSNPEAGYALQYPPSFVLQTNVFLNASQLTGALLTFPANFQTGTAYDEATVEITSSSGACVALDSLQLSQTGTQLTIAGTPFTIGAGSGVGAGNLYQTFDYETEQHNMCHRFALIIHSCNLGPDCGTGHSKPLDRNQVVDMFEQILSTATFTASPAPISSSMSSR